MTDSKATETPIQGIIIPPEPQVLVDIHMEQFAPNPDISHIADLISQDVGLSSSVLKLVNSPCYALPKKVESIKEAVNIIGIEPVTNIINGLSIKGELNDEAVVNMTKFWDSATDVATIAMMIANRINYPSPDTAYNLGLFHNCGIALLMISKPGYLEIMEKSYSQNTHRIIDIENEEYKTNHAVLGYYAAKSWHCSKSFCEVIADHHNSEKIFKSEHFKDYDENKKTLLGILKMSEHICSLHKVLGNCPEDHEWNSINEPVFDHLGISTYEYDAILDLARDLSLDAVKELGY